MSLRKLTPNDILPLLADYLNKAGLPSQAEDLADYYDDEDRNVLHKYSLIKMIKFYISNKKKISKHFQKVEEVLVEEEEEVVEEVPKRKKVKLIEATAQKSQFAFPENVEEQSHNRKGKFFQKCNDDDYDGIREQLRDNTFEAKSRFGTGDAFGQLGNEKLKFTRGDMFKKEKGKLKNRQFQGMGSIDAYAVNSIKL